MVHKMRSARHGTRGVSVAHVALYDFSCREQRGCQAGHGVGQGASFHPLILCAGDPAPHALGVGQAGGTGARPLDIISDGNPDPQVPAGGMA
jgi:hypothetical protein